MNALVLTVLLAVPGQWGAGGCGPVGPAVSPYHPVVRPAAKRRPKAKAAKPKRARPAKKTAAARPPRAKPKPPPSQKVENFGVDWDKVGGPEYAINGRPATRQQVCQALEA